MSPQSTRNHPNAIAEPIAIRNFDELSDPDTLFSLAFHWILAASRPYFYWLCGQGEVADRTIAMWMRQPSSEASIQRMQFLQYGPDVAAGFIVLGGSELKKARSADMDSLWGALDVSSRGALIEKLSQSAQLFMPVDDDEYYGSKMAVSRPFLGKGLAQPMMNYFLEQGNALGYSRFRLDVQAENKHALRFYLKNGFETVYTGQTSDGALTYQAMRLERKCK